MKFNKNFDGNFYENFVPLALANHHPSIRTTDSSLVAVVGWWLSLWDLKDLQNFTFTYMQAQLEKDGLVMSASRCKLCHILQFLCYITLHYLDIDCGYHAWLSLMLDSSSLNQPHGLRKKKSFSSKHICKL